MAKTVVVKFDTPIASAHILKDYNGSLPSDITKQKNAAEHTKQIEQLHQQRNLYHNAFKALQNIATKLNQCCNEVISDHKEEIARLSVEIARKVLVQKVKEHDYEIERIVEEALENAPARKDLTVRVNSDDLAEIEKARESSDGTLLKGVELIADSKLAPAECIVESPKGIVKSLIDEQLEQIFKALTKSE